MFAFNNTKMFVEMFDFVIQVKQRISDNMT